MAAIEETTENKMSALPPIDVAYDPTLGDGSSDEPSWTALQLAARKGDASRVAELLSQIPSTVNDPPCGYYGQTAIQTACIQGHEEVVEMLINAGADIHFCGGNNMQRTALQFACGQGNEKIVDMLLRNGAQVNMVHSSRGGRFSTSVTRYNGRTALQAAAERGHKDIVIKMLRLGADVNAPPSPSHGRTALQGAAENGFAEIIRVLSEHGADANAPGAKYIGLTALQAASFGGHVEAIEALVEGGAEVDAQGASKCDGTALHAAAERGHVEAIKKLVQLGAKANVLSIRQGQTPLQRAHRKGQEDAAQLLRQLNLNQ
jgi:ankyrin repeat protein